MTNECINLLVYTSDVGPSGIGHRAPGTAHKVYVQIDAAKQRFWMLNQK